MATAFTALPLVQQLIGWELREERMTKCFIQRNAMVRLVFEHTSDQIEQQSMVFAFGHHVAMQRFAILAHVSARWALLIPVETPVDEVSRSKAKKKKHYHSSECRKATQWARERVTKWVVILSSAAREQWMQKPREDEDGALMSVGTVTKRVPLTSSSAVVRLTHFTSVQANVSMFQKRMRKRTVKKNTLPSGKEAIPGSNAFIV